MINRNEFKECIKNKIKNIKTNKDGERTSLILYSGVFLLATVGMTLNINGDTSKANTSKTDMEHTVLDKGDIINNKTLTSARLIEEKDEITNEVKIHLCNIEFSDKKNDDNVYYRDIFSRGIVCEIPISKDNISRNHTTITDIGLYTDISKLLIIEEIPHRENEIKQDLKRIEKTRQSNDQKKKGLQ